MTRNPSVTVQARQLKRRLALLHYIEKYTWQEGYAPSQREMQKATRHANATVRGDLAWLEARGWIERGRVEGRGTPRAYAVTIDGDVAMESELATYERIRKGVGDEHET